MTVYIGQDGRMRDDSLMHWKYIKKIKAGSSWRYFYTPEEVRAYYKEEQGKANAEYKKDLAKENKRHKEQRDFEKNILYPGARRGAKSMYEGDKSGLSKRMKEIDREQRTMYKRETVENSVKKKYLKARKNIDPVAGTAKAIANKPRRELRSDVKDAKDYYKMQEKKANKTYKKNMADTRQSAKETKEVLKYAKRSGYVDKDGNYKKLTDRQYKAGTKAINGAVKAYGTYSKLKKGASPAINTGKAIINKSLKKEVNAERMRRVKAANKKKRAEYERRQKEERRRREAAKRTKLAKKSLNKPGQTRESYGYMNGRLAVKRRKKMKNELYHYGVLGMKWGVRKDRYGSGYKSMSDSELGTRQAKLDRKTGELQRKVAKYNEKAAKYNRKANRVKRRAANPIVNRTDLREAANYKALRLEGKGLKYTHKAEKTNKKLSKLNKEAIELGHEHVRRLEAEHPDIFEPGWRDKYKDPNMFDVTATKKGNTYHVQSGNKRSKR